MQKKALKPKKPAGRPAAPEHDLWPGRVLGELTILGKVNTKEGVRFRWKCSCGETGKSPRQYFFREANPKRHCGCKLNEGANPYPREKGIWQMMHQRTENTTHVSYAQYGGRGIKVCPEWHKSNPNGWENFIKFMGPAPTKTHTIDRVNPNLGYQPYQEDGVTRQVRWATPKEQANNKRSDWAAKQEQPK